MRRRRLLRLSRAIALVVAAAALQSILAGPEPACAQAPQQDEAAGMSEEELALRIELLQRSMGSGGIFGPALQDWLNSPSAPETGSDDCGHYTYYVARQACDLWAADRLQQDRASPAERDWYNR